MGGLMLRLTLAVGVLGFAPSLLHGQAAGGVDEGVLLSMPEPPEGYTVTKQRLEVDGKPLGYKILVAKEGSASKVIVSVETSFDRSAVAARVAATKGYVNGLAGMLKDAGFGMVESKLPDVERETFTRPVHVEMTFGNAEGARLHTHQIIFFTDKGFSVQIASTEKQDVESLTKWAKHIKPAGSESDSSRP